MFKHLFRARFGQQGEAINSLQNLRQKIEDLERELAEAERSFNLERAGQIKLLGLFDMWDFLVFGVRHARCRELADCSPWLEMQGYSMQYDLVESN